MDTSIVRMALVIILKLMEYVGIYIPARYHMIRSKIDIISHYYVFSKLPFLESIHAYTSTLNIYGIAMPYMSLKFFRLKVIEKCTNFYFGTEKLPPKF